MGSVYYYRNRYCACNTEPTYPHNACPRAMKGIMTTCLLRSTECYSCGAIPYRNMEGELSAKLKRCICLGCDMQRIKDPLNEIVPIAMLAMVVPMEFEGSAQEAHSNFILEQSE